MLTEFELVNISPEIGTERALKTVNLYSLPEDTCVVFFHHLENKITKKKDGRNVIQLIRVDEELGWYYIQNGKTHVGGHVPCMLGYNCIKGSVVRVMWSGVDNFAKAQQRFLLYLDRFKVKYGQTELRMKGR